MKKIIKIILIIFIIVALIAIWKITHPIEKTIGVVIKVNEDSLLLYKEKDFYSNSQKVEFSDQGDIGFKKGQEVEVYYTDKVIDETGIHNVKKIKILKEKSDIELPDDVLTYFNNSLDKVSVLINEFTSSKISFVITDTNEIPFEFSEEYSIRKIETDGNWTELNKNSDVPIKDTIEKLDYNVQNIAKDKLTGLKIDWSVLYGDLQEGEYIFKINSNSSRFTGISIKFKIDSNGILTYDEPQIEY